MDASVGGPERVEDVVDETDRVALDGAVSEPEGRFVGVTARG